MTATHNYTGYGWEGHNYNRELSTTEIAKIVRKTLKAEFPECKFSVTSKYFSGGSELNLYLMEAPFDAIVNKYTTDHHSATPFDIVIREDADLGNAQLNDRTLVSDSYEDSEGRCNGAILSEAAWNLMKAACELVQSYNFDDSDSMIDYFHTNFYFHAEIGKWDRPFVNTNPEPDNDPDGSDEPDVDDCPEVVDTELVEMPTDMEDNDMNADRAAKANDLLKEFKLKGISHDPKRGLVNVTDWQDVIGRSTMSEIVAYYAGLNESERDLFQFANMHCLDRQTAAEIMKQTTLADAIAQEHERAAQAASDRIKHLESVIQSQASRIEEMGKAASDQMERANSNEREIRRLIELSSEKDQDLRRLQSDLDHAQAKLEVAQVEANELAIVKQAAKILGLNK